MARPLRLCFKNAVYHITARGNRKEEIFYSDKDKHTFLSKMNEAFEKYSFICYSYCLMDNHYHLFIKTPLGNLSNGMHYLNTSYSNWFRVKYDIVGPIFQGRYISILVDEDNYALLLSAYIHLNPLRANLVKRIYDYRWSSFLDYIGVRKMMVKRLDTLFILEQMDQNLNKAKKRYKEFVVENINMKNPFKEGPYENFILGSKKFIKEIKGKVKAIGHKREIKETRIFGGYKKEEIINSISEEFGIKKDNIFKRKKGNINRQLVLYLLKRYTSLSLKEIGELFNMDYAAVSQATKRFEEKVIKDKKIFKMKDAVLRRLKSMSNVET